MTCRGPPVGVRKHPMPSLNNTAAAFAATTSTQAGGHLRGQRRRAQRPSLWPAGMRRVPGAPSSNSIHIAE
jgi:hypothetical protein